MDFNEAVSTLTAKLSNLIPGQIFQLYGTRCNVTDVSTDALEGERYELGVELVGGHAVDEEGEVFQ